MNLRGAVASALDVHAEGRGSILAMCYIFHCRRLFYDLLSPTVLFLWRRQSGLASHIYPDSLF